VLADIPGALHVRLDGPVEARLAGLVRRHPDQDEAALRHALQDNDTARAAYVRHLYRLDPCDCRLYHLVIDSTALGWDTATELVVTAARARGIDGRG